MSCTFRDHARAFVRLCVSLSRLSQEKSAYGQVWPPGAGCQIWLCSPEAFVLQNKKRNGYEKLQSSESRRGKQALDPNDKRWL